MNACPRCNGTGWVRLDVPVGHPDFGTLQPCPDDAFHADDERRRLYQLSGLLEGERGLRLSAVTGMDVTLTRIVKAASQSLKRGNGWLYIHGTYGNGKTLVLQALVCEFVERGTPAHYATFAGLLDVMRQAFGKPERGDQSAADYDEAWEGYTSAWSRFNRLRDIPVLCVDEFDIGKYNPTRYADEVRFRLLDERYRRANEIFTAFAGNQPPSQWPPWLRSRIGDGRFVVVEHKAPDLRPSMMWRD